MKKVLVGLLVGASALLCTACGSSMSSKYESAMASEDYAYDYSNDFGYEEAMISEEYADGYEGGSVNAETVGENAVSNRKLITTVNVTAEATDYEECVEKVKAKINQCNGYIESESCGTNYGNFTIRIPSANLDEFMTKIEEYSNVTYYSSSCEDVTLTYVDIESRISSLRTEQSRLETLMSEAETVEDIITIENRLSDIRYELQSYESQKRTYDNKIDYSTVNLDITEVKTYTPEIKASLMSRIGVEYKLKWDRFVEHFEDTFIALVTGLPFFILNLIPFGAIFCAIFFPVRASVRKKKAKKQAMMANAAVYVAPAPVQNVPTQSAPAPQTDKEEN